MGCIWTPNYNVIIKNSFAWKKLIFVQVNCLLVQNSNKKQLNEKYRKVKQCWKMNIFLTSLISTRFSILRMLFAGDKQYFQPIRNQTNFLLIFDLVNCKIGLENSFISINWGSECLIEILTWIIIFYRWREINFCSYTGVPLYLLGLLLIE